MDHTKKAIEALIEEPVRITVHRQEAQTAARPQALKNQRRIRWNTLRILQRREQCRCLCIIRRSRRAVSNRSL